MKAVILAIGDELVSGQTVDTNSAFLARELGRLGVEAVAHGTVGDDRPAIAEALRAAAAAADVVLVSGGLGPTVDDLTRHALADALGVELVLDEAALAKLQAFFDRRGRTMAEGNRVQALFPAGTERLVNEVGTADGIAATLGRARVFVVPGVPHEMHWMWEHRVAARLASGGATVLHRVLHSFGAGESDVGDRIRDLMTRSGEVTVGTTVAAGLVSVRITARGVSREAAEALLARRAELVRERLGDLLVGEGEQTLASRVGEALRRAEATLATAESCTGGLLGELITSVPGSSDYYLGGVVSYADEAKVELLGVPRELLAAGGAVSETVAAAMAEGARRRLKSHWALALTGIAGPRGGSEAKPVGLVYVGLAGPAGTRVQRCVFAGDRPTIRLRSALTALNMLRLALEAQT